MTGKIVILGCSAAMITAYATALHSRHEHIEVIVVNDSNSSKIEEKVLNNATLVSVLAQPKIELIQLISKDLLNENDINYATYFYTEKVYEKQQKAYFLLNNKSSYIDKSPARNKNDSVFNYKLNILNSAIILLNHERPHIRSPGFYI